MAAAEIGRIAGMDPIAAEFYRHADITPMRLLNFADWSQQGLEALMLARMLVVIGPTAVATGMSRSIASQTNRISRPPNGRT